MGSDTSIRGSGSRASRGVESRMQRGDSGGARLLDLLEQGLPDSAAVARLRERVGASGG